jgi:hypothetical protein
MLLKAYNELGRDVLSTTGSEESTAHVRARDGVSPPWIELSGEDTSGYSNGSESSAADDSRSSWEHECSTATSVGMSMVITDVIRRDHPNRRFDAADGHNRDPSDSELVVSDQASDADDSQKFSCIQGTADLQARLP